MIRVSLLVKCVKDPASLQGGKLHEALESGDTKTVAKIILSKTKVSTRDCFEGISRRGSPIHSL